jgi:acyl-CoA synthetase (AMP-forming)/AMP-acid ligase II
MVLSALEGIEEVVVIGMESPDGRDEIVRAVIACSSGRPRYRDIANWCRHRLAGHKVPSSVVFVDAIPRTARGKIDRSALLSLRSLDHDPGGTHD